MGSQERPTTSMSKINVAPAGMGFAPPNSCTTWSPNAYSGGQVSFAVSPTDIFTTARSQHLITSPAPTVKAKGSSFPFFWDESNQKDLPSCMEGVQYRPVQFTTTVLPGVGKLCPSPCFSTVNLIAVGKPFPSNGSSSPDELEKGQNLPALRLRVRSLASFP